MSDENATLQIKPMSAEESLKLAITEQQRGHLFDMMREQIRRVAVDALYAATGGDLPEGFDEWLDHEATTCLLRMLSICNGDGWAALSKPIMDKRHAEQLRLAALQELASRRMFEFPNFTAMKPDA